MKLRLNVYNTNLSMKKKQFKRNEIAIARKTLVQCVLLSIMRIFCIGLLLIVGIRPSDLRIKLSGNWGVADGRNCLGRFPTESQVQKYDIRQFVHDRTSAVLYGPIK